MLDGTVDKHDRTLDSPGESKQRTVPSIITKFNDSFMRKDQTAVNYVLHTNMEEDSAEKKEVSINQLLENKQYLIYFK